MEHVNKIGGINLLILVIYLVLFNITATGTEAGLEVLIYAAFAIGAHVGITFLVSIVMFITKDKRAKAFLLSSLAVLIVGFSACMGSMALY